jgi:hypothetical protein
VYYVYVKIAASVRALSDDPAYRAKNLAEHLAKQAASRKAGLCAG